MRIFILIKMEKWFAHLNKLDEEEDEFESWFEQMEWNYR